MRTIKIVFELFAGHNSISRDLLYHSGYFTLLLCMLYALLAFINNNKNSKHKRSSNNSISISVSFMTSETKKTNAFFYCLGLFRGHLGKTSSV